MIMDVLYRSKFWGTESATISKRKFGFQSLLLGLFLHKEQKSCGVASLPMPSLLLFMHCWHCSQIIISSIIMVLMHACAALTDLFYAFYFLKRLYFPEGILIQTVTHEFLPPAWNTGTWMFVNARQIQWSGCRGQWQICLFGRKQMLEPKL